MTMPNDMIMIMVMIMISSINMMTTKSSIMCLNLVMYTAMMSMMTSMKIKMSPVPFIVFLTMIGGLMIIFLYLAATMWKKKDNLTLTTKISIMTMIMMSTTFIKPSMMVNQAKTTINLFDHNMKYFTMMMIWLITMLLIFTIEMHMKANLPFRKKPKMWK